MFPKIFDLSGRVALVTGGSKGLGKAMARGLAQAGADVVLASRHEGELKSALDEVLQGTSRKGRTFVADLAQRGSAEKLAQEASGASGRGRCCRTRRRRSSPTGPPWAAGASRTS